MSMEIQLQEHLLSFNLEQLRIIKSYLCMVTICHKYYHDSVFQKKTENKINTAMEQNLQKYIRHFTCLLHWNKKINHYNNGMLPVKRTIKNNKFLYRQPCYGWRYFMLLLYIAHDISLVSLHAVSFEVVGCCSNLCN